MRIPVEWREWALAEISSRRWAVKSILYPVLYMGGFMLAVRAADFWIGEPEEWSVGDWSGHLVFGGIFMVLGPLLTGARRRLALSVVVRGGALDTPMRWWDPLLALGVGALVATLAAIGLSR